MREVPHNGMTLRDYFAGQALAAMTLEGDGRYSHADHNEGKPTRDAELAARAAYRHADAMLAQREKEAQ